MSVLPKVSLLLLAFLSVLPVAMSAQLYTISTDGQEVTDTKTGLIWRRCAEGMAFSNGTCNVKTDGTPTLYTHEAALTRAANQAGTAAWRLPNVKELTSIVDRNVSNPAIDSSVFPATPSDGFWSASPSAGFADSAYYVYFGDGYVSDTIRSSSNYVRLVRAGQ